MPRPRESAATVVTNGVRPSVRKASLRLRMLGLRGSLRTDQVLTMHTRPQFRHFVYSRGLMIVLAPYDRAWPPRFATEATRLRRALPDLFVDLQHVGSTAIPGLVGKPVIDMQGVVESIEAVDLHRETFEALGYEV